jgi:hypothetical protein
MKRSLTVLIGTFLFAGALAVAAHPGREPDYAKLQAELKMTDQQLAAFKTERERHREAMRVFHEDTRARGELLFEEHRDRLSKVLSPGQMEQLKDKFHEHMAERRELRRERMRERKEKQ